MDVFSLVINTNTTVIQTSDPNTSNLVFATWAIAIATIIGIIITTIVTSRSLKESKRTNHLMALELKTRFKPHVDFTAVNVRYIDTKNATFVCTISNSGEIPLSNITIFHEESLQELSVRSLLENESEIKEKTRHKVDGTLEAPRYHSLDYSFKTDKNQNLWIALWLNYEYLDEIKEEGMAIFYFKLPNDPPFEVRGSMGFKWFSHNDIQTERKSMPKKKEKSDPSQNN